MIALALSCEPELLIADEPTTALDVTIQAQILTELRDIQQELDTAILFITHDLAVVAETTTTVNVMYAGEIIEKAGTDELFQNPQHPYTQKLLQSVPRIDDPTDTLEPIEGTIPELINIEPACHFAPRCPEALDECYERKPDMRTVGSEEHVAACLRRGKEDERL
jgi:oligopeptide/dipeptide ABC transporter ATP-binding protein